MASALFSFIDSIGETFEGVVENVENVVGSVEKEVDSAVQQIDAGVDLDDVLEEIQLATDEAALLGAYKRLEGLAQCQTATILHGWVVEDRVVPVVCAALCRVESAKMAAGPLARTLNGMGQALDSTGTTPEELRAFHEQIVRRTENGKAMVKLLQAQGVASRTQGLALLRRVYPETRAVLGRHLLSDPESISALMEILQDSKDHRWDAEEAALCAECVRFLRLVTANDGDVRMIVTFQDAAEALLQIASHALSAGSAAGSTGSGMTSASFLSLAADACVCVLQLVGQGPVAQKYMREAGHLPTLIRSLRGVLAALSLTEASDWAMGLRNVATVLLESVASFVSSKAGNEAEQNSKTLVQSAGLVEMVCLEVLPYPQFDQLRLQATETLAAAIRAVPEASLGCFKAMLQGRSVLDRMVAILLGEGSSQTLQGSAPLDLRKAIEVLLAVALERSAELREVVVTQLETAQGEMTSAGLLLLTAFRTADQRMELGPPNAGAVWWPSDANTWFAARLLGSCIRGQVQLRLRLARPPAVETDVGAVSPPLLAMLLGPTAALARAWRKEPNAKQGGDGSAGLCALLQLLAEWCHDCPAAAEVLASSPALLPELIALLESFGPSTTSHVHGLAALLLGTCLLELPKQGSLVTSSQLMEIIASKGMDLFTRAAEDFLRCLSLEGRYHPGFQDWVALQFQKVQDAMVQIWLQRAEAAPQQGMAEDVAGHFKDLIKMQDKELRDLRQEVQKLKTENDELRQLTTDEDKTILLWKVGALSKQCEALQVKCDLLEAARSSVEVARLRERQSQRQQREELEQQLQILALALDEAEICKETQDPMVLGGSCHAASEDPADAAAVVAERDELLSVLSQINRSCPEAAGFLAPLGRFVPSTTNKEVSAWEAAAERVGQQVEALSELAESHRRSLVDLQERASASRAAQREATLEAVAANGWHATTFGGQSDQGVQSHTESPQQKQSQEFSRQAQQQNQLQAQQSHLQAQQSHQQAASQQAQQQSQLQAQQSHLQAQQSHQQAAAQQAQQQSHWQTQQSQLQEQQCHEQAAQQAQQQSQLQAQQSHQQAAAQQAQQNQLQAQQSQLQAQQSHQQAAAQQALQQSHWQTQQSQLQEQRGHQQAAQQAQQQSQLQAQQSQLQAQQSHQQAAAQQAQQQSHWQTQQSQLQEQQGHQQAAQQAQQQSQLQAQQHDQHAAAQQAQQNQLQAQQSQLQAQQSHQQVAAQQAQQRHWQTQQSRLQEQQGHQQAAQQAQQQSQLQAQQHDQHAAAQQAQQQQQQQQQQSHEREQNHLEQQNGWNQLPTGWVAYSTAEGHVFYYNQSTGQSQWERPG